MHKGHNYSLVINSCFVFNQVNILFLSEACYSLCMTQIHIIIVFLNIFFKMYENNNFLIFHTSISTRNKVIKKKKRVTNCWPFENFGHAERNVKNPKISQYLFLFPSYINIIMKMSYSWLLFLLLGFLWHIFMSFFHVRFFLTFLG